MTRIILRNDTSDNWTKNNPVLASGEAGVESNSGKFKLGDGTTAWNNLPYAGGESLAAIAPVKVENGVVSLNIDGQTIQVNQQGQLACNLDEIGNDLTSKANIDLSNISEAGKQVIKDNAGGGGTVDAYTKAETDSLLNKKADSFSTNSPLKMSTLENSVACWRDNGDETYWFKNADGLALIQWGNDYRQMLLRTTATNNNILDLDNNYVWLGKISDNLKFHNRAVYGDRKYFGGSDIEFCFGNFGLDNTTFIPIVTCGYYTSTNNTHIVTWLGDTTIDTVSPLTNRTRLNNSNAILSSGKIYYGSAGLLIADARCVRAANGNLAIELTLTNANDPADTYTGTLESSIKYDEFIEKCNCVVFGDLGRVDSNQYTKYNLRNITVTDETTGTTLWNPTLKSSINVLGLPIGDGLSVVDGKLTTAGGSTPDNMVTLDTEQTITAKKSFTTDTTINSGKRLILKNSNGTDNSIQATAAGLRLSAVASNYYTTYSVNAYDGTIQASTSTGAQIDFLSTNNISKFIDGTTITYDNETQKLSAVSSGSSSTTDEKYGIRGDYSTHYGILDCPNGLIYYGGLEVRLQPGVVLQCAGSDIKTTIASEITKTLTSTSPVTLFYAGGELLECGSVSYSESEPADNGVANYQAWFKPSEQKWYFKSNDTGNVFRTLVATPIANINIVDGNITRLDYIGYRILDNEIVVDTSSKQAITGHKTFSNGITSRAIKSGNGSILNLFTDGTRNQTLYIGGTDNGISIENLNDINALTLDITSRNARPIVFQSPIQAPNIMINDLSNISVYAKDKITSAGFPYVNVYTDLTLGASGESYTAPADGYFLFNKAATAAGQYITMGRDDCIQATSIAGANNSQLIIFLPVHKGDIVKCVYTADGPTAIFHFTQARGVI